MSILSIFHSFWAKTDMDQHKSKKKNVFFRKKDPFEMHERRLTRFLKVIFTLLLFQVGENWVSKGNKCENSLQRSQHSLEIINKRRYVGLYYIFIFLFIISHESSLFTTRELIFVAILSEYQRYGSFIAI